MFWKKLGTKIICTCNFSLKINEAIYLEFILAHRDKIE